MLTTKIECNSPESATAVADYLSAQFYDEEERPAMAWDVTGDVLNITYAHDNESQRKGWDLQLLGYRDAWEKFARRDSLGAVKPAIGRVGTPTWRE